MRVTVLSPERSWYDGDANAVVAPAYDGQVGILPRHAPFLTLLGEGTVTVQHRGGGGGERAGTTEFRVAGGFLQVAADVVRVVADVAEPRPGV